MARVQATVIAVVFLFSVFLLVRADRLSGCCWVSYRTTIEPPAAISLPEPLCTIEEQKWFPSDIRPIYTASPGWPYSVWVGYLNLLLQQLPSSSSEFGDCNLQLLLQLYLLQQLLSSSYQVFPLKVDGVAFRLIPEASQVNNAISEMKKVHTTAEDFPGIPVFQSKSLALTIEQKRYRPVFFRMEDLEKYLERASK